MAQQLTWLAAASTVDSPQQAGSVRGERLIACEHGQWLALCNREAVGRFTPAPEPDLTIDAATTVRLASGASHQAGGPIDIAIPEGAEM